jgi:hypothetical protein
LIVIVPVAEPVPVKLSAPVPTLVMLRFESVPRLYALKAPEKLVLGIVQAEGEGSRSRVVGEHAGAGKLADGVGVTVYDPAYRRPS